MANPADSMDWQPTTPGKTIHHCNSDHLPSNFDFTTTQSESTKATRPVESTFFSAAKRLCTGLTNAYYAAKQAFTNIVEATYQLTPQYIIVRRVRQRQREQLRRPQRLRRRSPSPLTGSPANRIAPSSIEPHQNTEKYSPEILHETVHPSTTPARSPSLAAYKILPTTIQLKSASSLSQTPAGSPSSAYDILPSQFLPDSSITIIDSRSDEIIDDENMPVVLKSPFDTNGTFTPPKRPSTPEYRASKHARHSSTESSSSDEPVTPQKQIVDIKKFLKKDDTIVKLDTQFTPVRPSQLQTPWQKEPSPTESEFQSTITWDPREDKEYRKMLRQCPETKDQKTGEFLPIDGILSPEALQHNIDIGRSKQLKHTLETPGLSSDLSKLSIEDRTPKASRYREQRDGRITRANKRRLELEQEKHQYRITPLSHEWDEKVKAAVRNGHGNYLATDFARVVPQYAAHRGQDNWLNDEVINGYLKLVSDHGKKNDRKDQVPSHHAFNSFFYTNLRTKGPDSIKNWAKRAKIGGKSLLDTEKVFIPINQGMHWTLAVMEAKQRRITVFNSMGSSRGDEVTRTILAWVQAELGATFNQAEWILDGKGVSPQQQNSDDCGVFTITNARQIMLGKAPVESYGSQDIPVQRMRIVAELVNGGLLK